MGLTFSAGLSGCSILWCRVIFMLDILAPSYFRARLLVLVILVLDFLLPGHFGAPCLAPSHLSASFFWCQVVLELAFLVPGHFSARLFDPGTSWCLYFWR